MNIALSIDEQLVERARERLRATGKTINQEIREHLEHIVGDDEQLERDLEFLRSTAGPGNSNGWRFNREELYERRLGEAVSRRSEPGIARADSDSQRDKESLGLAH